MSDPKLVMRELFIDELAEVTGGATGPDPLERVAQIIKDLFVTTGGCGEEGPQC